MKGKELLRKFRKFPVEKQTKILVTAYLQIDLAYHTGKALTTFTWRDCELENDIITFNVPQSLTLDSYSKELNHKDYAALIYCLSTGRESSELIAWDADKKVKARVLREIVLTLCGKNDSIEPLIEKLREPYTDEQSFFRGYQSVDDKQRREEREKEARAYKERIDEEQEWRNSSYSKTGYQTPFGLYYESRGEKAGRFFNKAGRYFCIFICISALYTCIRHDDIRNSILQTQNKTLNKYSSPSYTTYKPLDRSQLPITKVNTESLRFHTLLDSFKTEFSLFRLTPPLSLSPEVESLIINSTPLIEPTNSPITHTIEQLNIPIAQPISTSPTTALPIESISKSDTIRPDVQQE